MDASVVETANSRPRAIEAAWTAPGRRTPQGKTAAARLLGDPPRRTMVTGSAASLRLVPFPRGSNLLEVAPPCRLNVARPSPARASRRTLYPSPPPSPARVCGERPRRIHILALSNRLPRPRPLGAHAFFAMSDEFVRPRETGWAQRGTSARLIASSAPICERPAAGLTHRLVAVGGSSPEPTHSLLALVRLA